MQQAIVDFALDDENHWYAILACGHTQHVRHDPPWQNRPWVITEQGRKEKLGVMLELQEPGFRVRDFMLNNRTLDSIRLFLVLNFKYFTCSISKFLPK